MPDLHSVLIPRAAFADLAVVVSASAGVIVEQRDGLGVATVLARRGKSEALADRLRGRFNIELPRGAYRAAAGTLALAGTGPASWLATQESGANAFATVLREAIGDLASVADQSDGYAMLRLSGPKVRDVLAQLIPIDVHPRAFKVGAVAATVAAHIGAAIWRLDDGAGGCAVFEIVVSRSLADSFRHALLTSATSSGRDHESE